MSLATTFLPGAKGRLLPASVPFRYFTAAVLFHLAFWAVLGVAAAQGAGIARGPSLALAALHLLTIGVLLTTAMGAAFQLLPVSTRQPMPAVWPTRLGFWLVVPGAALLAIGMAFGDVIVMMTGGGAAAFAAVVLAVLMAINLARAPDLGLAAAHSWISLASLLALAVLGVLLIFDYRLGFLTDHASAARLHFVVAVFGFMGMLVAGFSQILVPMFVLGPSVPKGLGRASLGFGILGLLAAIVGISTGLEWLVIAALAAGAAAAGCHLESMRRVLARRMRKRLDIAFVVMRIAWLLLPIGLALALAEQLGQLGDGGPALVAFALVAGWLLTFLLAVLQRIMPFLAAMHAGGGGRAAPRLSQLAAAWPLRVHAACHVTALVIVSAGIGFGIDWLVAGGSSIGFAGAIAFALFAWGVVRHVPFRQGDEPPPPSPQTPAAGAP